MKNKSIKNKITLSLSILILITALISSILIGIFSYNQSFNDKQEQIKILSETKVNRIDSFFEDAAFLAQNLAQSSDIKGWLNNETINENNILDVLNSFNIHNHYSAIYILDSRGVALISTDPTFINKDYSFRDYFKTAISGKSGWEIAIGVTSNKPGFYISEPIKNNREEIIGVAVMKMEINAMAELLEDGLLIELGEIMLTDTNGIVIFSTRPERVYQSLWTLDVATLENIRQRNQYAGKEITPLPYDPAKEIIESKATKSFIFYDPADNEKELVTIASSNEFPLSVVTESELKIINNSAIRISLIFGLLALFLSLLSLLGISILLSRLLKPIATLKNMAEEIGQGKFPQKNEVKSGDELETLSTVLINTSKQLKGYYGKLEEQVLARTKELNDKNANLENTKKAIFNILEDVEEEKNKVTNLAKDLEKFKLALDNASDHIVITDAEGLVIYGNQGVEKITGYLIKDVLGQKAGKAWGGLMSKEYYQEMWNTIKNKKQIFTSLLQNKRKTGEIYDATISISPVLNKENMVEFFVAIERDVTKEKEIDRAKTEFVSLASHQLRTPLSSINWYAEMLLAGDAGKLSTEQNNFISEIYKGNQRMVDLVNALLNVSRLELGTFTIEPEEINIIDQAKSVIKELTPGIEKKKMKIITNFASDTPLMLADPKLIRIVFQNLLSNAIKYTPEKGKVEVEIKKQKKDLLIKVADNGYGIPKLQQDKIFSKLFRADNIRSLDTEGTGLGLYILKSIVDHSGGQVWFESSENKGTAFFITIPLSGMKKKEGTKSIS